MSHTKFSDRTFHRKYEESFGNLTADQFPPIDWASKTELEMLFPLYKREYLKLGKKAHLVAAGTISLRDFELWTPTKTEQLFKETTLTIENNKRCAVYGINGSGKTMLFHSIAKGLIPQFPLHVQTHHMEELSMDEKADAVSVMETVISSCPMRRVLACMEPYLETLIAEEKDEARLTGMKANLAYVKAEMQAKDGYNAIERASKMLRVLGFDEKGEASLMSSLSGGLRMRVALTCAFFINPDLLLLDEPTNHLDLPSVLWLENKLRGYSGSFLLVTHDRHILENVVTSVMQLQDQKIVPFSCGFAQFEKDRESNDKAREKMIEQFMLKNRNIDNMSAAFKVKAGYQAWAQKRAERKVAMEGKFKFKTPKPLPCPAGTKQEDISLIKIENVRFCYDVAKGLPFIFDNPVSYEIKQGTRVGVMGPNGAGKSTILKLITGNLKATEGKIITNPDFTLAYFGQHSTKELKMDETALEFMVSQFPKMNKGDIVSHLEKTSISRAVMDKRMAGLSFSQRSCVIFAKLTFVPPHLLIMDEPTNFLDLDSVDSLIHAANSFPGALITVTHNRDFLKRCSKNFLSIVPGAFLEFDTMKDAERATYSFIGALERGETVDHKQAILDNRGGGAVHTEEYLAKKEAERKIIFADQAKARLAAANAEAVAAAEKADKEAKAAAKKAATKTNWVAGEVCWAPIPGGKNGAVWTKCTVKRVIRDDVTVELPTGGMKMIPIKKLKQENPEIGGAAPAAATKSAGKGAPRPQTAPGGKGGRGNTGKGGGKGAPKTGKGGKGGRGGK
jgi:ATP-binding cassette subfamily F protein 3